MIIGGTGSSSSNLFPDNNAKFTKMKPVEIITYAFIFKKDKNNLYTFASYSLDGGFGDRNVIPLGVVKDFCQI